MPPLNVERGKRKWKEKDADPAVAPVATLPVKTKDAKKQVE